MRRAEVAEQKADKEEAERRKAEEKAEEAEARAAEAVAAKAQEKAEKEELERRLKKAEERAEEAEARAAVEEGAGDGAGLGEHMVRAGTPGLGVCRKGQGAEEEGGGGRGESTGEGAVYSVQMPSSRSTEIKLPQATSANITLLKVL